MSYVQQKLVEDIVMNERVVTRIKAEDIVAKIADMFQDQEFGFDVFVLMKDEKKTIKKFVFYEKSKKGDMSFKDKIQNSIVEIIKKNFVVEKTEYVPIENAADDQHKIYILPQDEEYAPLACLNIAEKVVATFEVSDYDDADAILFRFRRGMKSIWAYQSVNPVLIPNKKGENFLVKALSTESSDKFVEMSDKIFTITKKINLLVIDENIITRDLNLLQRHFGFEKYIRTQAEKVVNDIITIGIVDNEDKLSNYIQRTKKQYAKKMMRIKQYNVIRKKPAELISKISEVPRWRNVFEIENGKIKLNTFKDVENLIDLFDERYTRSLITDDEFDTDVKKLANNENANK